MTLDHVVWGIIGILLGLNGWLGNRYIVGLETSIKAMAEDMGKIRNRVENLESHSRHVSRSRD